MSRRRAQKKWEGSVTGRFLSASDQNLHFTIYHRQCSPDRNPSRLLLLHGTGAGGDYTWKNIVPYLDHWDEILVPDLRGAGETFAPNDEEAPFTVDDVLSDLNLILDECDWNHFDIAGYSFGGYIAVRLKQQLENRIERMTLIEAAMLSTMSDEDKTAHQQKVLSAAEVLLADDKEAGVQRFLELVVPDFLEKKRLGLFFSRLTDRPRGMGYTLLSLFDNSESVDVDALAACARNVDSIVGDDSYADMIDFNVHMAAQRDDWHCHILKNADHSLIFQYPREIADILNRSKLRFLQ